MKVTVVGPSKIYPARKDIQSGDKLTFKKKLSSEFGKTVEVYNEKGEQIGFIAARTSTADSGTYLAEDIFDNNRLDTKFYGIVESFDGKTNKMIASLMEEDKMEKEIRSTNENGEKFTMIYTTIEGPKKLYPNRYVPSKKLKKGESVPAQLEITDDKILVNIQLDNGTWQPCGHVSTEKVIQEGQYKTYQEILTTLNRYRSDEGELPKTEAVITGLNTEATPSLIYLLDIKVFGKSVFEQLTENIKQSTEVFNEEDFENLKNFLETLNLSEEVIVESFKMIKDSLPQDPSRIPNEVIFNNYDEVTEDVLYSIIVNGNTMLCGPMASGKNTMLEMLANKFKKALYEVQVNSYIDNDVLLGTKTIKAKDFCQDRDKINDECRKLVMAISTLRNKEEIKAKLIQNENNPEAQIDVISSINGIDFSYLINAVKNGETEIGFLPSAIVVAMERGSWVVVDEFNTGQASVMSVLNSVLDDRKRIQVPGYGLVQAAPGFRLFATMNPEYEGTFNLNQATASRFNFVMFKPADKIGPIILSRVPSTKKDFITICERIYKKIRDGIESGKLQEESINIRSFIEAAKMVSLGRPFKKALIKCVANGIQDNDDREAVRSYIEIEVA